MSMRSGERRAGRPPILPRGSACRPRGRPPILQQGTRSCGWQPAARERLYLLLLEHLLEYQTRDEGGVLPIGPCAACLGVLLVALGAVPSANWSRGPDPAQLSALMGRDASPGDRLAGPSAEARLCLRSVFPVPATVCLPCLGESVRLPWPGSGLDPQASERGLRGQPPHWSEGRGPRGHRYSARLALRPFVPTACPGRRFVLTVTPIWGLVALLAAALRGHCVTPAALHWLSPSFPSPPWPGLPRLVATCGRPPRDSGTISARGGHARPSAAVCGTSNLSVVANRGPTRRNPSRAPARPVRLPRAPRQARLARSLRRRRLARVLEPPSRTLAGNSIVAKRARCQARVAVS